jgi:diadenosine tetraphosphate (Ap4A) HIT family hydrolase
MALEELTMKPFGPIEPGRILAQDELFLVAFDEFPASPGHALIVVKRLVSRFQELTPEEKARLLHWVDWCQDHLDKNLKPKPDGYDIGYNLGISDGAAAGQTIDQLHVHVIPRYKGDVPDPRGGVRYVVPGKARYWEWPKV